MATQQDLQELLRLQTARKLPIKDAMAQIKALQLVNLRSIQQIADAPLPTVESALKDAKASRSFQNACKAYLKRGQTLLPSATGKRPVPTASVAQSQAKRFKQSDDDGFFLGPTNLTPQQLESSLALPLDTNEARIADTAIETNRAPLVLAFAVELIRHTMPEQPPSSRLSLAQAVVSANSRSKAISIGLDKGASADDEGWSEGQPRVKVMGREVAVLKRGGYEWRGEEEEQEKDPQGEPAADPEPSSSTTIKAGGDAIQPKAVGPTVSSFWSASSSVSLKKSVFIAHATTITDPSQRPNLLKSLFNAHPNLRTASHNVWAYRIRPSETSIGNQIREASYDDDETGGGDLLLRVMRETNIVDTLVVMTRWYGGIMLGPDRWRLMRNVVTSALSERLRRTGIEASLGGEAVWGLDLEAMRNKSKAASSAGGFVIHRPEAARNYMMRNFASATIDDGKDSGQISASPTKKKTARAQGAEKEENLGLLLGSLRLLFDSWANHLTVDEMNRRAWGWYVAVRPDVESGPSGWGAKGVLRLKDILKLRRNSE